MSNMNGWFSRRFVATWVTLSVQARNIYAMTCNSNFFKRIPSGNQTVAMENHPFIVDFSNKNLHLLVVFQLTMLDYQRVPKILQTLGTDGIDTVSSSVFVPSGKVCFCLSGSQTAKCCVNKAPRYAGWLGWLSWPWGPNPGISSTWASNLPMDTCYLYMAPNFWPHIQYHLLQTYASWKQHQHMQLLGFLRPHFFKNQFDDKLWPCLSFRSHRQATDATIHVLKIPSNIKHHPFCISEFPS